LNVNLPKGYTYGRGNKKQRKVSLWLKVIKRMNKNEYSRQLRVKEMSREKRVKTSYGKYRTNL